MSSPRAQAFTLIEVVLAIALTLGLLGATMGFHHHVQTIKRNVLSDTESTMTRWRVMDRITAELQSAMVYLPVDGGPIDGTTGMSGSGEEITFLTAMAPGPAAWAAAQRQADGLPPQHDVQAVTYRISQMELEDGALANDGLARISRPALPGGEQPEGFDQVDRIGPEIRFLRLRYHVGDPDDPNNGFTGQSDEGWVDTWEGPLPLAVELTLGRQARSAELDVESYLAQHETFRRVVYLPGTRIPPVRGSR